MTTTVSGSYPAVNSDSDATINGLTVGKGGGASFYNTVVGAGALAANTTGIINTAVGSTNGANATLSSNTTGNGNNAFGAAALGKNTTASQNNAFGYEALRDNTTGANNVAVGGGALLVNTTASNNTAVGHQAGNSITTGAQNTLVGKEAGREITTGSYNAFFGVGDSSNQGAGYLVTTGAYNTIIGGFSGNQGGLDIRTANNYIVLSDGQGNPRQIVDGSGNFGFGINPNGFFTAKGTFYADLSGYAFAAVNAGNNVNRKGFAVAAGTYDSSGTSTMVEFFDGDGNAVGTITNASGTVSYNAFLGAHYTEVQGETVTLVGTVYDSIDELVEYQYTKQDRLPKVKVSDVAESTSVYGVYLGDSAWNDKTESITGILVASVGAGWVRIAQGVTVQKGDLLVSNGDGCAKVQSDDIVRSKTIGKVVSNIAVETYTDGSYIVPTVLYCG